MASKFVLYSYYRSSCSWRVRAVLKYKKIPYEYKAVNLLKGEQYGEEFKKINPLSFVPTLQFQTKDGKMETLFESIAIVDYLEQTHPEPSIYPKDPLERAKVIAIVETIVSGIQPIQNLGVLNMVAEWVGSKEKSLEWAKYWIETKFKSLEQMIKITSGKYAFGDQLTLADICLVPQIANALRFNVDMDQFPTLNRLNKALLAEECIAKSHPDNQPDKP